MAITLDIRDQFDDVGGPELVMQLHKQYPQDLTLQVYVCVCVMCVWYEWVCNVCVCVPELVMQLHKQYPQDLTLHVCVCVSVCV